MSKQREDRTYKGDLISGLLKAVEHAEKEAIADQHAAEHQPKPLEQESNVERYRR